jgi:undecaprenyl diphosphate synthase
LIKTLTEARRNSSGFFCELAHIWSLSKQRLHLSSQFSEHQKPHDKHNKPGVKFIIRFLAFALVDFMPFLIFANLVPVDLKSSIFPGNVPKHVAIIMDGNGRWAKKQGEDRVFGHHEGVNSVREIVEACGEIGVSHLTLYAFSTENWNRPKEEVDALMELLVTTISMETPNLNSKGVKLEVIGDIKSLPASCQRELKESMDITSKNNKVTLILALSYSSKWEITHAVQQIAKIVEQGKLKPEQISSELIEEHLSTSKWPDPELMIRTSGEHRISNFLLWQLAYSEFYFTEVLWPDFRKDDFFRAILAYQNRERRFGKTSEQLSRH